MEKEIDQFFADLENDQENKIDIFEQPLTPEPEKEEAKEEHHEEDDGDDFKPKNRRERRLMDKLQKERESSIFLAGKLEARTEAERTLDEESDYLKAIDRIYGTDTPEAQLATELLKKAIVGARDDAEMRAYERVRQERERETKAEAEASNYLDEVVEEIQDSTGVELNQTQKRAYFQLLKRCPQRMRMARW